jgi:hypothetical protein
VPRARQRDRNTQDFGIKSQDWAGPSRASPRRQTAARSCPSLKEQQDKVEIQIALKALLFLATFMAARSLTAYFDGK